MMNRLQTQDRADGSPPWMNQLAGGGSYLNGGGDMNISYLGGRGQYGSPPSPDGWPMQPGWSQNLWPGTDEERNAWMPWAYSQTTWRKGGPQAPMPVAPPPGGGGQEPPPDRPQRPTPWDRGQPSGGRYGYTLDSSVPWDYHPIEGYDFNGPNVPGLTGPPKNLGPRGDERNVR